MKDRRKSERFPVELNAIYADEQNNRGKCKVIEISREGTKIALHLGKKIDAGTILQIEIEVPARTSPVSGLFSVVCIKELEEKKEFNFVAGGTLIILKPGDTNTLLRCVFYHSREKDPENIR